jgi:Zn-dependent M16 (insulinase) family peptidase
MADWETLLDFNVLDVRLTKYRSKKTGLKLCLAAVEGPLVNGFLTLATETHDDDGLPHTLEHLIFMGSEEYPAKGVLDLLANRCLAQGTNAWTDVDHTCYTMTTAGSDGFLTLLPIYLDHVLYPTLTVITDSYVYYVVRGSGEK